MKTKRRPHANVRRVSWRMPLLLALFALCQVALANPPRVSLIEGKALYESADDVEVTELSVNLPLVSGDRLYVIDDARVEIQQGPGNIVRLAGHTDLKWLGTEDVLRIELTAGELIIRIVEPASHKIFTPFASVRLEDPGLYRISVDPDGRLRLAVREGRAEVANRLRVREVSSGEQIFVDQPQSGLTQVSLADPPDAFEQWSVQRDEVFRYAASSQYLDPSYQVGVVELDQYGQWENVVDYGQVWFPQVNVDFVPYQAGRWVHYPRWGWTWISYEPWGWLPYHYGRWVYYRPYSRWCWIPGRSSWSGALVDFYYGGGYVGWAPRGHHGWGSSRRFGSGFGLAIGTPGFSFVLQTDFGRDRTWDRLHRDAPRNVRNFQPGLPREFQRPRGRSDHNVVRVGRNRNGLDAPDPGARRRSQTDTVLPGTGIRTPRGSGTGLERWRGQNPEGRSGNGSPRDPRSSQNPPGQTLRERQGQGTPTPRVMPAPSTSGGKTGPQGRISVRPPQTRGHSSSPSRSSGNSPRVTTRTPSRSPSGNSPRVTRTPSRPSVRPPASSSRPPSASARPGAPVRRPSTSGSQRPRKPPTS